ncbi:uncharacterized protein A4U43_C08F3150 [Asparagus officinalis]|nr:uncharacterized protein A4U43_C08F3150 [Asparagus officinalis]
MAAARVLDVVEDEHAAQFGRAELRPGPVAMYGVGMFQTTPDTDKSCILIFCNFGITSSITCLSLGMLAEVTLWSSSVSHFAMPKSSRRMIVGFTSQWRTTENGNDGGTP